MIVRPEHVDADGRLTPGVAFSLADCAMSLAGNAEHRAVAITAGLRPLAAAQLGDRIHARLERSGSAGDRTVWEATVGRSDGTIVARFTGTTLRVADRS
jgi:acyl-coenzyme A thioesterase PaaI-like protein